MKIITMNRKIMALMVIWMTDDYAIEKKTTCMTTTTTMAVLMIRIRALKIKVDVMSKPEDYFEEILGTMI